MRKKVIFSWSGGKDSSYCLYKVLNDPTYEVVYLLTTLNTEFKRISMHGVKEELLDAQSQSIGVPQLKVWVGQGTNEEYELQMSEMLLKAKSEGIETVLFGDIFLEDLRKYREENMAKVGMKAEFPIWKTDTSFLIQDFIEKGFETVTCCINDAYFDEKWVGKKIDSNFIKELPSHVDPCGENGEYHTYCFAGPIFKKPIKIEIKEKVYKPLELKVSSSICSSQSEYQTKGFWFCELDLV
ncbi:MAG: diphthine--ammonia ligase [Flavobacteriia bacterium]|nr:diphthine--ammonia ligase [Flavobacteriia bacterium]